MTMDLDQEAQPLLPFPHSFLDSTPIYSVVLDIYDLVVSRVDISLKYDQLKSPQIYSFLVKPIVGDLRQDLNPGTLYALMANMHQFAKESTTNAAMSGVMATRSTICEIVAIRLLKDYDDDDLMDALTYDFYPLANGELDGKMIPRWQRISTLELAIKAEAKRFLAHPVVTQVLEEIWNGSVMFQSSMHKLHRARFDDDEALALAAYGRRGPGIRYRYEDASILKLSRLRVPRYRHVVNLLSYCALLCLYVAVLSQKRPSIDPLNIVFWLWSLGFILDEVVGFSDAGFTLYVMSLWNWFDLIILILLVSYAGTLGVSYVKSDHALAATAQNILGTVAIFLFPRLFSILDNYKIFSQMVVSVKRMMVDLTVACIVIVIFSSGFWVAFTMAFGRDIFTSKKITMDLLKILFGFTPTVWDNWNYYSWLGRFMLVFYLFITHFVIMTILIAVLSNSFSAVIENANEEHQYMFAVNTITMIKSESSSLFAYTAPLNVLEWIIRPLFYCMPLRRFLVLNRTVIKVTHFPVLLAIFMYEKIHLRFMRKRQEHEKSKEVQRKAVKKQALSQESTSTPMDGSSTSVDPNNRKSRKLKRAHHKRLKETKPKVSNDDLLDEVFKRPYKGTIKVKPNITLNGDDATYGYSHMDNRFNSQEVNSDPETTRRHDETEYSDIEDDDDDYTMPFPNFGSIHYRKPALGQRIDSRSSQQTVERFFDDDSQTSAQNSRRRRLLHPVGHRSRLFSTASSLVRHGMGTLALSPTRSTASVIERHLRQNRRPQTDVAEDSGMDETNADYGLDDDDASDDERSKVLRDIGQSGQLSEELQTMSRLFMRRMDTLETGFKNIELLLSRITDNSASISTAYSSRGPDVRRRASKIREDPPN